MPHPLPDPALSAPRTHRPGRAMILLLLLLFLARGLILLCVLPPFEQWDEYQHLAAIDYCSQHDQPMLLGQTTVDPDFARAVTRFPLPANAIDQLIYFGATSYQDYWKNHAAAPAPATTAPITLYEAQHPPLYYRLMVPLYQFCGGRDHLALCVAALRGTNLLFAAAALALIFTWIGRMLPSPINWLIATCIALNPLLLLNSVRVANDALAFLLATLAIGLCLSLQRRRLAAQITLLALLLPAALMTKATSFALIPTILIAITLAARQRTITWPHAALALTIIFATTVLLTATYLAANLQHFHMLAPMQEAVRNTAANRGPLDLLKALPLYTWPAWLWEWWVDRALWTGGWSYLAPAPVLRIAHAILITSLLAATALIPFFKTLRRRWPLRTHHTATLATLLITVSAGLLYHAAHSAAAWDGLVATNPWYAAIGIPWWILLLGCTAHTLIPQPRSALLPLAALALIYLATESYGLIVHLIPEYAQLPFSRQALDRLATLQPPALGNLTFHLAQLLFISTTLCLTIQLLRLMRPPPANAPITPPPASAHPQ